MALRSNHSRWRCRPSPPHGWPRTNAAAASLLLTLEGVATALMARFLFRENFDRGVVLGMGCLVAGVVILSWSGRPSLLGVIGPLAIVGGARIMALTRRQISVHFTPRGIREAPSFAAQVMARLRPRYLAGEHFGSQNGPYEKLPPFTRKLIVERIERDPGIFRDHSQ